MTGSASHCDNDLTFRQPSQDEPGKLVDVGFEAQFAYLSNSANQALPEDVRAGSKPSGEVVPNIVSGFRGVEDEHRQALGFSADALAQLSDLPGVASVIVRTFFASRAMDVPV